MPPKYPPPQKGGYFFVLTFYTHYDIILQNYQAKKICSDKTTVMRLMVSYSNKEPITSRLAYILFSETHTISLILGILGLILGIGFLFGDTTGHNFKSIVSFGTHWFWASGFIFYGIVKLCHPIFSLPVWLSIFNTATGIWAWSYIILSFIIFDKTPTAPTEYMLVVPLLLEVVLLAIHIFEFRGCPKPRKECV